MMDRDLVLEKLAELPEAAQQQVLDYIAFLHTRYGIKPKKSRAQVEKLESEPFVGIWCDRQDMQDSTRWVRESRQSEWQTTC